MDHTEWFYQYSSYFVYKMCLNQFTQEFPQKFEFKLVVFLKYLHKLFSKYLCMFLNYLYKSKLVPLSCVNQISQKNKHLYLWNTCLVLYKEPLWDKTIRYFDRTSSWGCSESKCDKNWLIKKTCKINAQFQELNISTATSWDL